jgi:hypothetical protein
VDECEVAFCAETLYDLFLRTDRTPIPLGGTFVHKYAGRELTTAWCRSENVVWRYGRVFFLCPRCRERRTRLYIPVAGASVACGSCWGLTYASRTHYNYKDSLVGRGPIARLLEQTHRDRALLATLHRRELRRTAGRQRQSERYKRARSGRSYQPAG